MAKIDGLEIVMTKQMQKMIDKELKKRIEELKPELATRYEELLNMRNMEADQFNDGFNDARAGKLETDHPHYDFDTDNWRLGFAWGMFEPMKEKLARERQVSDALYLLLVDDPNTKLKAEQILIDIYGKCEPSPSDVSVTQDVLTDIKTGQPIEKETCSWIQEDDPDICYWKTGCGNSFYFTEGTPTDNNMKYCCYCGKLLKQEE